MYTHSKKHAGLTVHSPDGIGIVPSLVNTINIQVQCLIELLIGTRESLDSRVQAGLASPSPALKGLVDSPRADQINSHWPRARQIDSQTVNCLLVSLNGSPIQYMH